MNFQRLNCPSPYSPQYKGIREYDKDLAKMLETLLGNLASIFEGGISLNDNLDKQIVAFSSNGTANTEDAIAHTLKRVPVGFLVVKQDKSASFYASGTAWTATHIYLKSSVASVAATVIVF